MRINREIFTETLNQLITLKDFVLQEMERLQEVNEALVQKIDYLKRENAELTKMKTPAKASPDMFYIGLLVVGFVVGMLGVVYNITM